MKRKRAGDAEGGASWMDTYGDMMTLLLTFFVMLYSMTTMDAQKWKTLASALSGNPASSVTEQQWGSGDGKGDGQVESGDGGAQQVTEFNQLYYYLKDYVDKNGLDDSVLLSKGENFTFIAFQNNIFFKGDSAVLQDEGKALLDYLAGGLAGIPDQVGEIRFQGHTAQVELSFYNTESGVRFDRQLSVDRATNVLLYVQMKGILNPNKLIAEGYGQYRPAYPHDGTEATRMKNRRVEIYIIQAGSNALPMEDVYDLVYVNTD